MRRFAMTMRNYLVGLKRALENGKTKEDWDNFVHNLSEEA